MGGPILRSDINTFVEQAKFADELLIGTQVCPPFGVPQIAGQYPIVKIQDGKLLQLNQPKPRSWSSEAPIIQTWIDNDSYECFDYSAKQRIDQILQGYYTNFGLDQLVLAAKIVHRWQMLKVENDIASTLFNTANFTSISGAVPYLSTNAATLNFPQDFQNAWTQLVQYGVNPARATLILPLPIFQQISRSTIFQYFVRGNRPQDSYIEFAPTKANLDSLASLLGIARVLIAQSYVNSTAPGSPAGYVPSALWSNSYFWLGVTGEGDFSSGGAARYLYYEQAGAMLSTMTYFLPQYNSTDIEISLFAIPKVIDSTNGVLVTTGYTGA